MSIQVLRGSVLILPIGGAIGMFSGFYASCVLSSVVSHLVKLQPKQNALSPNPGETMLKVKHVFTPEWTLTSFLLAITFRIVRDMCSALKALS